MVGLNKSNNFLAQLPPEGEQHSIDHKTRLAHNQHVGEAVFVKTEAQAAVIIRVEIL